MTACTNLEQTALVSVCIANYNGAGMVEECIDSILAQDFDFPVQIIVHDDASTDSSADLIAQRYPQVLLLRSSENKGFCVANNRMAAMAKGKYLLLLNNDATLFPDALASLLDEAQRLAVPAILTLPQLEATSGKLLDVGSRLDPFFNPVPNLDSGRNEVGTVHGACLWIDKSLWEALGGFPEWFSSVAEDLYLCCRARLAGYPVRALWVSGYRHRVGQSFGGGKVTGGRLASSYRRRSLSERNKTFVMVMTCPQPFLLFLLPIHFLVLFGEGVLLSIFMANGDCLKRIYLPAIGDCWRLRQALWATRGEIMQQRRLQGGVFFSVFNLMPYKLFMAVKYGMPRLM